MYIQQKKNNLLSFLLAPTPKPLKKIQPFKNNAGYTCWIYDIYAGYTCWIYINPIKNNNKI